MKGVLKMSENLTYGEGVVKEPTIQPWMFRVNNKKYSKDLLIDNLSKELDFMRKYESENREEIKILVDIISTQNNIHKIMIKIGNVINKKSCHGLLDLDDRHSVESIYSTLDDFYTLLDSYFDYYQKYFYNFKPIDDKTFTFIIPLFVTLTLKNMNVFITSLNQGDSRRAFNFINNFNRSQNEEMITERRNAIDERKIEAILTKYFNKESRRQELTPSYISMLDEIINLLDEDMDTIVLYAGNSETLGFTNEIAYIKGFKYKLTELSNEDELHEVPKSYYFDKTVDNIITYLNSLCHVLSFILVDQIEAIVEKYFPLKEGEKEDEE